MSQAYQCDRCGKYYSAQDIAKLYNEGSSATSAGRFMLEIDNHPYESTRFDLCPSCRISLKKWYYEDMLELRKEDSE